MGLEFQSVYGNDDARSGISEVAFTTAVIPEPHIAGLLLLLGFALLGGRHRLRKK